MLSNNLVSRTTCFFILILAFYAVPARSWAQTYDEVAYQGYLLYAKGLATKDVADFKRAGDLLREAAVLKKRETETILWDAAMIYASGKDTANTLAALEGCLSAGMIDVVKVKTRPLFDFVKQHPAWQPLIRRFEAAEQNYITRLKEPALRQELLTMWAVDQRDRFLLREKVATLNNNWGAPELKPYYQALDKHDSLHYVRIQEIVKQQGWPKISAVGKDGSFAAWAVVQHAKQVLFQKECINAMKLLLANKEVSPVEYAELVDRVQMNQKLKQVYGMAIMKDSETPGFYPIEDEEHVDQRRKAIGLEPLAVAAHLSGFKYKKPVK